MAMRIVGRVRTMRRLVMAVVGLCDPRGSTAPEIIEWTVNHPCGTTRCQHPPPQGSEMQRDRARLLAGLRYSVQKGILEEHGGRYKLAMESCGRPWPGPRQDARPRVTWARRRRSCRALAHSRARPRHRHSSARRSRRRAAASRGGRRRRQARATSRRRQLRSGRDRARSRARARATQQRRTKRKDKDKAEGSGGCGCGQGRPEQSGDDRRASHLMYT